MKEQIYHANAMWCTSIHYTIEQDKRLANKNDKTMILSYPRKFLKNISRKLGIIPFSIRIRKK